MKVSIDYLTYDFDDEEASKVTVGLKGISNNNYNEYMTAQLVVTKDDLKENENLSEVSPLRLTQIAKGKLLNEINPPKAPKTVVPATATSEVRTNA